jgi:hypothetical protein
MNRFDCIKYEMKARHGRDHMVVGFTTTYAISDNIPLMQCTRIHKQNIMLYTSP